MRFARLETLQPFRFSVLHSLLEGLDAFLNSFLARTHIEGLYKNASRPSKSVQGCGCSREHGSFHRSAACGRDDRDFSLVRDFFWGWSQEVSGRWSFSLYGETHG